MVCLESLPAELMLCILESLPDLKALDALQRSSIASAAVFSRYAPEILELVMAASLHIDTAVAIRIYVLLVADRHRSFQHDLESLRTIAEAPIDPRISPDVILEALSTFTYFNTLCYEVAIDKLEKLYALPHRHSRRGELRRPQDYDRSDGIEFEVPDPGSLAWIEEQRIMKSLFELRSRGLLNLGPETPENAHSHYIVDAFSMVVQCQELFKDHLDSIMHADIPQECSWIAPAVIPNSETGNQFHDSQKMESSYGWFNYHAWCVRGGLTPLKAEDWPYFRELGLGIWSFRRLVEDLRLVEDTIQDRPVFRQDMRVAWWSLKEG
ncbi:hypothetical protein LTR17_002366 [Elasticomyces elasticus]|nr:hypothetical protein LTR17_002366 [Elasticomyces elasticus]